MCTRTIRVIFCLLVLLFSGGCANEPVRHLASDAALIQPGVATVDDVHRYLGEPNGYRSIAPGCMEYVYREERPGPLGKVPVAGKLVPEEGYEMIIITLKDKQVIDCEFRTFNKDDKRWADDFTWDEVE